MDLVRMNNEHFFAKKTRSDGRKFMEHRDLLANINPIQTADASVTIKLGNTSVLCGIKFALGDKQSTEDLIDLTIRPYCLEEEMPDSGEICAKLDKLIKSNELIDLESLSYLNSDREKRYFSLSVELDCLNNDGNIFDAFLLAFFGALNLSKFSPLTELISSNDCKLLTSEQKLDILKFPIPVTFAIIKENLILLDPNREEEQLANGKLKMVFNAKDGGLVYIEKNGGLPLEDSTLVKLILSGKAWASKFYQTSALFHPESTN